jgi:hypothetical protein
MRKCLFAVKIRQNSLFLVDDAYILTQFDVIVLYIIFLFFNIEFHLKI